MKKILGLAIIFVFIAAMADATLPLRDRYTVKRAGIMAAAKASLSAEGVEKLKTALAKQVEEELVTLNSIFFLENALIPDLQRNDSRRVKKFLKMVNDKRLVRGDIIGGGPHFKGGRTFRIVYSLEESVMEKSADKTDGAKAGAGYGKKYYLKALKTKPGKSESPAEVKKEIRLDQ
jgi:hypothetical protein